MNFFNFNFFNYDYDYFIAFLSLTFFKLKNENFKG